MPPIHQSAPHIYLSALAFVPPSSVLRGLCKRFPKMVKLRQDRMTDQPRLSSDGTGVRVRLRRSVNLSKVMVMGLRALHSLRTGLVRHQVHQTRQFACGMWLLVHLLSLIGHEEIIWSIAFSPQGEFLISSSNAKTIRVRGPDQIVLL